MITPSASVLLVPSYVKLTGVAEGQIIVVGATSATAIGACPSVSKFFSEAAPFSPSPLHPVIESTAATLNSNVNVFVFNNFIIFPSF